MSIPLLPLVVHRGQHQNFEAAEFAAAHGLQIVAFVDDARTGPGQTADDIPVVAFNTWHESLRNVPSVVTALEPLARRALVERIAAADGVFLRVRPSDKAVSKSVTFGAGILTGTAPLFITSLTAVGSHVTIMTPASIGHDCVIGDFVTMYPSIAISGYVTIADDVIIGVGAIIVNGSPTRPLRVGRGVYIDAGAVVTKSVPANTIVVGNPGRPLRGLVNTGG